MEQALDDDEGCFTPPATAIPISDHIGRQDGWIQNAGQIGVPGRAKAHVDQAQGMVASAIRATQEDHAVPNGGGMAEDAWDANNGSGLQPRDAMTAALAARIEKRELGEAAVETPPGASVCQAPNLREHVGIVRHHIGGGPHVFRQAGRQVNHGADGADQGRCRSVVQRVQRTQQGCQRGTVHRIYALKVRQGTTDRSR